MSHNCNLLIYKVQTCFVHVMDIFCFFGKTLKDSSA